MSAIFVDGDTTIRNVSLLENGSAMDLTGCTVSLLLRNNKGAFVTITSGITIVNAAGGQISIAPDPAQINVTGQPYTVRWRVEGAGIVRLCPFPTADTWGVVL